MHLKHSPRVWYMDIFPCDIVLVYMTKGDQPTGQLCLLSRCKGDDESVFSSMTAGLSGVENNPF